MLAADSDAIKMLNVRKSYGAVRALNGLSFAVKRGERCALLGPNGSGKSTTLKILTGLLRPDYGEAKVLAMDPSSMEARRIIGYLPEDASPYRALTVRENLEYIGSLRGIENLMERIDKLLDLLSLREYESARVGRLSRGTVQKLAVALTLIHEPEVLLLDEPLNYLDIPTQEKVVSLLKNLNSTQLVSTHIMSVAERLTKRVVMISRGSLIWSGSIDDLMRLRNENETIESVVARMMSTVA